MGMKRRICDGPCGKRRRFDPATAASDGWTDHGERIVHTGAVRRLRWCPGCSTVRDSRIVNEAGR